jgi:hypothetical protein
MFSTHNYTPSLGYTTQNVTCVLSKTPYANTGAYVFHFVGKGATNYKSKNGLGHATAHVAVAHPHILKELEEYVTKGKTSESEASNSAQQRDRVCFLRHPSPFFTFS